MINYNRLGIIIKRIRKIRHLSQSQLAEEINVSVQHISNIETAKKIPSLETIVKIADALDTTVDRLLYGNIENISRSYEPEIHELLSDCSPYEKAVIYDIALISKKSLRENKDLLFSRNKKLKN